MAGNWFTDTFSDPRFKQFASEGLQDLGYGLTRGTNIGNALGEATQRMQEMQPQRDYASQQKAEEAKRQETINQTAMFLREKGAEDLAAAVEGGMTTGADAFNQWYTAQNQQADPFTLGAGDIRYDGQGNIIAQGAEAGPGTVINNNMGGTDEFYSQLDKNLATQTTSTLEAGMNAQSNNIRLTELERVLQTAPQGAQGVMVQAAGSLGLPVQGLDDVQAAQALISQMVPGQRPAGSGTMSDADLALFKASLPSIINQPGGNQKILQTMKAINEYTIQQAQIAQMVANREISPAEGRAMQAQVPNPLRGAASPASGLPPGVTIREIP